MVYVGHLSESSYDVLFGPSGCVIQDRQTEKILGTGRKHERNYHLEALHVDVASDGRREWLEIVFQIVLLL